MLTFETTDGLRTKNGSRSPSHYSSHKQCANINHRLQHTLELQGKQDHTTSPHQPRPTRSLSIQEPGSVRGGQKASEGLGRHQERLSPLVFDLFTFKNASRYLTPLSQWFSTGIGREILLPREHLAMSRDIFNRGKRRCYWNPVGKELKGAAKHPTRHRIVPCPPLPHTRQRIILPKMSITADVEKPCYRPTEPLLKHKTALGQEPRILWWQSHGNMAHKQPKLSHAVSSSCDLLPGDLAVDFQYLWGWLCGCTQPDLGIHMGMRWRQRTTVVMSISTPNRASCLFKTRSNQALEKTAELSVWNLRSAQPHVVGNEVAGINHFLT